MDVLTVRNLYKRYEGFALEDVGFSLREGTIMGFIGRNGAGKTTTLKSLLNFVHPDGGEILFFGKPFAGNEREIKQRVGFASGGIDYYPKKKLRTISEVTRRFYPAWDETAYRRYRERFALDENKTPSELSAGMRVKYALLLALSHRAGLLILDEPTSGLDPVSREDLLEVFLDLADDGVSILFSTHITSDLDKCAKDITYIRSGRIVDTGDLASFVGDYRILRLTEEQTAGPLRPFLIGCRRNKDGYTALIRTKDAAGIGIESEKADLESVMVHLEREG